MRKRYSGIPEDLEFITGFDGDDDADDADDGTGGDDGSSDSGSDGDDGGGTGAEGKPDTATLTMQKLRRENKTLAKELKGLRDFKKGIDDRDKSELDKVREAEQALKSENDVLKQEIITTRIDSQLMHLAGKYKFRDTDDVLRLVNRDDIEIDEETREVDKDSVEKAVKTLVEAKPHLIFAEGEALPPSGSKFGGKKKADGKTTEEALREKYPSLRR